MYPGMPGQHMTPGQVDPSAWAHNPQGTTPKQEVPWPMAYWEGPRSGLVFGAVGTVDSGQVPVLSGTTALTRAVWFTPVFDLAPKLEASSGALTAGVAIPGPGLLTVEILRDSTVGAVYNLYTAERVGAYRSDFMRAVGPATAQTQVFSDFTSYTDGTAQQIVNSLTFSPPPGVRFWQVYIIVDRMTGLNDGTFSCTAICR